MLEVYPNLGKMAVKRNKRLVCMIISSEQISEALVRGITGELYLSVRRYR